MLRFATLIVQARRRSAHYEVKKGARTLMSKKGMARVVQVLLCSVPGRLTRAQVIADVGISTIVHSLKVERGTKRCIISYALSMRVDKRVMLKR